MIAQYFLLKFWRKPAAYQRYLTTKIIKIFSRRHRIITYQKLGQVVCFISIFDQIVARNGTGIHKLRGDKHRRRGNQLNSSKIRQINIKINQQRIIMMQITWNWLFLISIWLRNLSIMLQDRRKTSTWHRWSRQTWRETIYIEWLIFHLAACRPIGTNKSFIVGHSSVIGLY